MNNPRDGCGAPKECPYSRYGLLISADMTQRLGSARPVVMHTALCVMLMYVRGHKRSTKDRGRLLSVTASLNICQDMSICSVNMCPKTTELKRDYSLR